MAEGTELAVAYLSLSVSAQGLRKEIDREVGGAVDQAGDKHGRTLGSRLSGGFKKAAAGGFLAAGALAGTALTKGFGRLKSLDDAQAKLTGLGHSTKTVDGIMKNALASVKGTAFGMDEAASTAAGAVAAGIKPGKDLQSVLTLVGDAATIAGTDMGSMGAIFNKVASTNKIQGDVIAQLGDQGIPVLQFLAKEMGVTAEEASKMASAGEVDFDTFRKAMQDGLGGAAQSSGKTFSGAMKNAGAALGRLGASAMSGVFPQMKDGFGGVTALLDRMGPAAESWGLKFGSAVRVVAGYVGGFVSDFKAGEGAAGGLRTVLTALFNFLTGTAIPALIGFGKWVRDNRSWLTLLAGTVAGMVIGYKAYVLVTTLLAARTKILTLAMKALNFVMAMGPWGWVAIAIGAVVAALIWLYKNNETARKIMQAAWAGIKKAISAVVGWLKTTAWPIAKQVFTAIGNVVKWLWQKVVRPYIGFMYAYWRKVFGFLKTWVWPVVKWAFGKIGALAKWLWTNAIKPYFSRVWSLSKTVFGWIKDKGWPLIRAAFTAIGDKAVWLWNKAKTPFDRLKSGVGAVKDAVVKARDGIKSAWSKLNGYLREPIRKAISWMNSKFIGGLNGLLSTKILSIPKSWRIPKIPGFATGGWTGPGARMQPAGVVHADEFVVKKSSRRKFERDNPGALDHINRFGALPGYAIGGKVAGLDKKFLEQLSAFNAAAGGRYSVNSGYRSIAHQQQLYNRYLAGNGPVAAKPGSSQHNFGLAADLAPSNARDVHGALAKQFGLVFTVPSESWHVEPTWGRSGKGGGGGFGGFGLPSWLTNPLKWVKDKMSGAVSGFKEKANSYGIAGRVLPATMDKLKDAVTSRVKKAADSLTSFGGGGGGTNISFNGIAGGTNKILGKAMAARYGWTGSQWSALSRLWDKESNWNHLAKNPSSGAYGIPQSLPASKMASVMQGGGSDYLTNPKTQISWGLKYIKGRYGNPAAALAFHNRMNWYAGGSDSARRGWSVVGENGPELVNFTGGQQVFNRDQTLKLARLASQTPGEVASAAAPTHLRIESGALSFDERGRAYLEGVATAVYEDQERHAAMRGRLGVGRGF